MVEYFVFRNLLISCSYPLLENCGSTGFSPDGSLTPSRLEFLAFLDVLGLLLFSWHSSCFGSLLVSLFPSS